MKAKFQQLVLCLHNAGYVVSLERRKIYRALPDAAANREGLIRVIDESGNDYLYPAEWFAPLMLPAALRKAVLAVA